jgi:hypothetical protein
LGCSVMVIELPSWVPDVDGHDPRIRGYSSPPNLVVVPVLRTPKPHAHCGVSRGSPSSYAILIVGAGSPLEDSPESSSPYRAGEQEAVRCCWTGRRRYERKARSTLRSRDQKAPVLSHADKLPGLDRGSSVRYPKLREWLGGAEYC